MFVFMKGGRVLAYGDNQPEEGQQDALAAEHGEGVELITIEGRTVEDTIQQVVRPKVLGDAIVSGRAGNGVGNITHETANTLFNLINSLALLRYLFDTLWAFSGRKYNEEAMQEFNVWFIRQVRFLQIWNDEEVAANGESVNADIIAKQNKMLTDAQAYDEEVAANGEEATVMPSDATMAPIATAADIDSAMQEPAIEGELIPANA